MTVPLVLSNFLAASRSVGTAATLAGAGIYMHRLGLTNDDSKKLLAKISQQITIPALLFTKIIYCEQDSSTAECTSIFDMMDSVWMIIFWPIYVVGCGLIVGHFAAKLSNTPSYHKPLVMASCAFANSTGLPITLLSVIHQNFPPSTDLGKIDATLFLSIYLLLYPVLQWGIGGWLLMNDDDDEVESRNSQIRADTVDEQDLKGIHNVYSPTEIESNSDSSGVIASYHGEQVIDLYNDTTIQQQQQQKLVGKKEETPKLNLWQILQKGCDKALQPPVIASLLGLFAASFNSVRGILVDIEDRNDNAPLEWIFDGLYSVGQAAVPINMMILGINLSKTIQSSATPGETLSSKTTFAVIVAKMVVMPIIGVSSVLFLKYHVWNIPDEIDDAFYLVLMMVFITPTANNVMIMAELGNKVSKEGISRLIGWQYLFAPVLLSINVSIVVYLVSG